MCYRVTERKGFKVQKEELKLIFKRIKCRDFISQYVTWCF